MALLNGVTLASVALLLGWESVRHLQAPEVIMGLPMLVAAGSSVVINGWSLYLLHQNSHDDLNLRSVFLHGVADVASSVGVMLATLAVYFLNWLWADAAIRLA